MHITHVHRSTGLRATPTIAPQSGVGRVSDQHRPALRQNALSLSAWHLAGAPAGVGVAGYQQRRRQRQQQQQQ